MLALLGAAVGWLTAALLVRLCGRANLPNLFTGFLAISGALPIAILSSLIALAVLYGVIRGGSACIHFFRPALFLPAGVTVLSVGGLFRNVAQPRPSSEQAYGAMRKRPNDPHKLTKAAGLRARRRSRLGRLQLRGVTPAARRSVRITRQSRRLLFRCEVGMVGGFLRLRVIALRRQKARSRPA